jgi:MFS family permease
VSGASSDSGAAAPTRPQLLPWLALAVAALSIAGDYYAYDAIAPVADLLRRQRGFSQSQIGLLNAIFSLPNIPLSLLAGVIIDRIGAARAAVGCAAFGFVGAALTAWGEPFWVMATGRLLFGIGEETLLIALLAGLARWFSGGSAGLAMSLLFSLARVGSYMADVSPSWAGALYRGGWRPPLVLAAVLTGLSLAASIAFALMEPHRRATPENPARDAPSNGLADLRSLTRFDRSFWYILWLNVLFASVFFPFRSTFAIVYFQDARGLSLAQAGLMNSWVFFAAIFATPVFGHLADRFGGRGAFLSFGAALMPVTFLLLATTHASLWVSTALMGAAFSVIPAVIWPATAMLVEPRRLGTAFGLINVLQSLGMFASNWAAGALNDANRAGAAHPAGYTPMLLLFLVLSLIGLAATLALWRRERGPFGHGLDAPALRPVVAAAGP